MDIDSVKRSARQYAALKNEISLLTDRQNELKSRLMSALEEVEADANGHRSFEFTDPDMGDVKITKQRRVTNSLDIQIAEEILSDKGIKDACIKMVPVLDEAAIMSAFYEGYLTEQDIDAMFPAKETYAFLLNK